GVRARVEKARASPMALASAPLLKKPPFSFACAITAKGKSIAMPPFCACAVIGPVRVAIKSILHLAMKQLTFLSFICAICRSVLAFSMAARSFTGTASDTETVETGDSGIRGGGVRLGAGASKPQPASEIKSAAQSGQALLRMGQVWPMRDGKKMVRGSGCGNVAGFLADRFTEGSKDRAALRVLFPAPFRMPLHRKEEPLRARHGNRLDLSIRRDRIGVQAGCDLVDALAVQRIHLEGFFAHHFRQQPAILHRHIMGGAILRIEIGVLVLP